MTYTKLFDPENPQPRFPADLDLRLGDRADRKSVYVYDDPGDTIVLSVNVALVTGRPLLVSGEPGTGKTSLADDVAARLGWRFYSKTVSSRTQSQDLLWTFDAVRRLADAQASREGQPILEDDLAYVTPEVLWWAFDRDSARELSEAVDPAKDQKNEDSEGAVVLLDEIDKADPDVPNNLLGVLGSYRFWAEPLADWVQAKHPPLVILTTNDERELPRAFLRRCISLTLQSPDRKRLLEIAARHFPEGAAALHERIADEIERIRGENLQSDRKPPSIAEYLDAIAACGKLGLHEPDSPAWIEHWEAIAEATLSKKREIRGGGA